MEIWGNLPLEILGYIYAYLSERDLLSCYQVCLNWRKAQNTVCFWKTAVVRLDVDFLDLSKIMLSRIYSRFVQTLEVGWEKPLQIYTLERQYRNQTTKRVVRFLSTLYDNDVQISSFRIFNWYDFTLFKKVLYHLCRFLKKQNRLKKVVFNEITLKKNNYMRLLCACLASKDTITYFDISDYCTYKEDFEPIYLYSYLKQLSHLRTVKLDYRLFYSNSTTRYIAENCCEDLENLDISLDDPNECSHFIPDKEWRELRNVFPELVVSIRIQTTNHFENFHMYLTCSIPLVSLSLTILEAHKIQENFANMMYYLSKNYAQTLEKLFLIFNNDDEIVDDPLSTIFQRCTKLNKFVFQGFFENFDKIRGKCAEFGCCLISKDKCGRCIVEDVNEKECNEMKHRRIKFVMEKQGKKKVCSLCEIN